MPVVSSSPGSLRSTRRPAGRKSAASRRTAGSARCTAAARYARRSWAGTPSRARLARLVRQLHRHSRRAGRTPAEQHGLLQVVHLARTRATPCSQSSTGNRATSAGGVREEVQQRVARRRRRWAHSGRPGPARSRTPARAGSRRRGAPARPPGAHRLARSPTQPRHAASKLDLHPRAPSFELCRMRRTRASWPGPRQKK